MKIPVMKPKLATFEEVAPFLQRIDQSHIYSNHGPLVRELEEAYSNYFKVDQNLVVALSNATQAIQGLVSISKNRNWIVPDYTFSATGLAVLNANRNMFICDVNLSDWKINVALISREQKSFGVIPVMPFGSAVDFSPYLDFDDVIIDAAASLGSKKPAFGDMKKSWAVVYSLHATKVLGAGEGAIVICGNTEQAESLRIWSNFGFSSQRASEIQGTNAKMSEMSAAYGLFAIQNREVEEADWLKSQECVSSHTSNCEWATFVNITPQFHPYWITSFHSYAQKQTVMEALSRVGIQSREWWSKPLSAQTAFADVNSIEITGIAKTLSEVHLGLPMYRDLDLHTVYEIHDVIHSTIKN